MLSDATCEWLGIDREELNKLICGDVREIFETMVNVGDIEPVEMVGPLDTHFKDCVTAMVGFAGFFNGVVSVHASEALAMKFTSQMLGIDVDEVGEDVVDALGEIANMIGGSFKHHLSRGGEEVKLSTPSVITGKEYFVNSVAQSEALPMRFKTGDTDFVVSVIIERD
ncbi:MAG TPA: chemotaxis protein CheX [Bacteroidota bacterium]